MTFFFFQAEDGIRDRNVTGVQTCALPILDVRGIGALRRVAAEDTRRAGGEIPGAFRGGGPAVAGSKEVARGAAEGEGRRSEERRVGKERRTRRRSSD